MRLGPEKGDRASAQPLHREGEVRQTVVTRQGLADQTERAHIQRTGGVREPPLRTETRHQIPAGRVHVAVVDRQARTPALKRLGKLSVPILEERPVEEGPVYILHPSGPVAGHLSQRQRA